MSPLSPDPSPIANALPAGAAHAGRTPDNTPLPGGGRWAWDDTAGAWVSRARPAPAAAPLVTPTAQPAHQE